MSSINNELPEVIDDIAEVNEIKETNKLDLEKTETNENVLKSVDDTEAKTIEGISSWFSVGTNVLTSSWIPGGDVNFYKK